MNERATKTRQLIYDTIVRFAHEHGGNSPSLTQIVIWMERYFPEASAEIGGISKEGVGYHIRRDKRLFRRDGELIVRGAVWSIEERPSIPIE